MKFIKKSSLFLIFLLILTFFLTLSGEDSNQNPEDDPEIKKQLNEDTTLMQMEQGALFVPYIIDQKLEPPYSIYQNDKLIINAEVGKRTILPPGNYTLYIGSGPRNFQQKIDVTIEKERTTVIKPIWSALIIRTIDQNNNDIRESYSILDEESKTAEVKSTYEYGTLVIPETIEYDKMQYV